MDKSALRSDGFHEHLEASFAPDLDSYSERVRRVLAKGLDLNADVIVLPACSILHRGEEELATTRSAASRIPWVFTGCLDLSSPRAEFSEVWNHGVRTLRFNKDNHVQQSVGDVSVVTAQSSTIRHVYQDPNKSEYDLALDLGHGQYNGRYKRVLTTLKKDGMQVILAFWRNQNGSAGTGYPWYEGDRLHSEQRTVTDEGEFIDTIILRDQP